MAKKLYNYRIEETVKDEFNKICESVGLNASNAITLFINKVVQERAIPFELKADKGEEK